MLIEVLLPQCPALLGVPLPPQLVLVAKGHQTSPALEHYAHFGQCGFSLLHLQFSDEIVPNVLLPLLLLLIFQLLCLVARSVLELISESESRPLVPLVIHLTLGVE